MKKTILILFLLTLQFIYANSNTKTILFLGDSLTEGLGVSKQSAYPNLVQNLIQTKLNKNIKAINAGVSGSTTNDGLSRLKWYLKRKPDIIFVALGANDGLRGLDLKQSQKNLEEIINYALKSKAKVLLAGMLIPPNYGPKYSQDFKKMYENIQSKYNLKFMPFLLKDVAGVQKLNQADGIHPNEKGHELIAKEVYEFLKEEI
ncbi:arylesterase [Poseidonibacter lekithochrous]|uniref:arylesterase n=1 Tax=Poseidonibacter lekithochrous TaxID=1904463 RepID=UPI0008FCD30F|nr:arylesterase [Poseidonibacter lekithochrous]QKJ23802.1 putative lysophospholipase L1-like arylesterase [Poseidonibacter lekithochrous]